MLALARPAEPAAEDGGLPVRYLFEATTRSRVRALMRLTARHPLGCARDLLARRRWRREERVLPLRVLAPAIAELERRPGARVHAHFALEGALCALRASRITGRPWSLTAHAVEIYADRRNLAEKLRAAALVTTGCEYTARDLRAIAGRRVEVVVMGVDPDRFRRRTPHPGGATIVAVGRLVEKKGFLHLIRALAEPALAGRVERVVIAGEGPERPRLEAEPARLDVAGVVSLPGALAPAAVRVLLEEAAVLAMPCVVAAGGDRDSMPVVVKEALAMEVPVVASDEVGLPEIVRPAFGRLVAPGDPAALARGLAELLALPPAERAAMGRAGRAHVLVHADVRAETAKLSRLLTR